MEQIYYCVTKYRKLLQLLEEDAQGISHYLQGDILEEYLRILEMEKSTISSAANTLKREL